MSLDRKTFFDALGFLAVLLQDSEPRDAAQKARKMAALGIYRVGANV